MTGPVLCIPANILVLLEQAKALDQTIKTMVGEKSLNDLPMHEQNVFWQALNQQSKLADEIAYKLRAVNRGVLKRLERNINRVRRLNQPKAPPRPFYRSRPRCEFST